MSCKTGILKLVYKIKKLIARRNIKRNKMRRRRESVASVYRKTTKFLSSNTAFLMKKMPNRRYRLIKKAEFEQNVDQNENKEEHSEDDNYLGEQDLDYYLGVRTKETFWRDPEGIEQIRKDFLVYHCGVTNEDYEKHYMKSIPKLSYVVQPRLKQVPFRIHRKKRNSQVKREGESWCEKTGIFKLFRRESEYSTSDSYSECESNEDGRGETKDEYTSDMTKGVSSLILGDNEGVRIKEVSEGRPCDNCPELCPGFIPHAWRHENCPWDEALKAADVTWTGLQYACLKVLHLYCKAFEQEDIIDLVIRKTCKSCGCDRLQHSVYHEELGSVRDRLGLRETRAHVGYESPPGLTAKQTELFWSSLAEREPNVGGATGAAAWREWRTRALATQLPKQDLSLSHTRHIDEAHRKQFEDFVAARNEIALDIGVAGQHHGATIECLGCDKPIRNGSITVRAPRLGEEAFFHPACFSCSECDELLVELSYCALDGRLFCVRHYADRLKPRCHACDEVSA